MQNQTYQTEKISKEEILNILSYLAKEIKKRGFEIPAILFLEAHKPLSFIASQMLVVAAPFFAPIVGFDKINKLSFILRDRKNIDILIQKIESIDEENNYSKEIPEKEINLGD